MEQEMKYNETNWSTIAFSIRLFIIITITNSCALKCVFWTGMWLHRICTFLRRSSLPIVLWDEPEFLVTKSKKQKQKLATPLNGTNQMKEK